MSKHYEIKIPIAGYVIVDVDAENEAEAKEKAFDSATLDDVEEWDLHEHIV